MAGHLAAAASRSVVYRLAFGAPWEWPEWSRAHADGTFGNRYDDPAGVYRVLYGSADRLGCFIETLARFRPDLEVIAGLDDIKTDSEDEGENVAQPGELDVDEWLSPRRLGRAVLVGTYCDAAHSESLAYIREQLASLLVELGYMDFDASTLRNSDRSLTQAISREVYTSTYDSEPFRGILYRSRLGDDLLNWAIFEGAEVSSQPTKRVKNDDPDLIAAARILGVTLV
jgi:RES domain